jgi:hypothetical protein
MPTSWQDQKRNPQASHQRSQFPQTETKLNLSAKTKSKIVARPERLIII